LFLFNLRILFLIVIFNIAKTSIIFPQQKQISGFLKIDTYQKNITFFVDSEIVELPLTNIIDLQPGIHKIIFLHPKRFTWGNCDFQTQVTISPADTVTITPVFQSILNIRSSPHNAEVYLNKELIGKTPFSIMNPKSPFTEIILKKEGFQNYKITSYQLLNNFTNVHLNEEEKNYNLHKLEFKNLKSHYRKLSYSLFGLSLISGFSSIYFKDKADQNYNKYLTNGSLDNMNNYFQKSKKYDRYTNAALGILQGCFLLSFYFLMKSFE